jgi:hypothetical protein
MGMRLLMLIVAFLRATMIRLRDFSIAEDGKRMT